VNKKTALLDWNQKVLLMTIVPLDVILEFYSFLQGRSTLSGQLVCIFEWTEAGQIMWYRKMFGGLCVALQNKN